jgi:hypothetical protein
VVLLEGNGLGSIPSLAELKAYGRAKRMAVNALYRDLRTLGRPTPEALDKLRKTHPAVAKAWGPWAATPSTLGALATAGTGAMAQILSSVPDTDKAAAYYGNFEDAVAADNLGRERAWAAMMDQLLPLVRTYVKPSATREEVEELALRIGLAADASGQSITPDRKLAEYPGARHASWMGGQIGYGGIGSWANLQNQAKQYLDLGFQWAEIFGRWSDPSNVRTLGNDTGAYPYLPTWAQPLAAKAWKNRRMISTELASYDGHAAHVEQRSRGWAAQMEPLVQDESAVGSPQVANAIIAAGTAANPVQLAVADPTYMAPWEKAPTPQPVAVPAPFADRPPSGAPMQMLTDADIPVLASPMDLTGSGIPYVKAVVDHAPPPMPESAPVPAMATPPSGTPAKVDPKTGLPPRTDKAAGTVPVPRMSPVPEGAQAMYASAMDAGALMPAPGAAYGGSWWDQEMIPGLKNTYLVAGAGALLLLLFLRSKRE